jgi:hypothetical protein
MMKSEFLMGLCLAGAVVSPAGCQELGPGNAGFGFTLAVTEYQIRDQVLNPIRHRGPSLTLELFRRSGGKDTRRSLGFSLLVDPLGDRYTTRRSSLLVHPRLDFRTAWRVAELGGRTSLFVGGSAGWNTHWTFHEQWDEQHVHWLTAAQMGVDAAVERRLGGGRSLHFEVGAPLLALVSRPPTQFAYREIDHSLGWVFGEIHSHPRLATPSEHLDLRLGITYSAVRDGRLRHAFYWRTTYVRNTAPTSRDVHIVTHSLGVSMPWPF